MRGQMHEVWLVNRREAAEQFTCIVQFGEAAQYNTS